MYTIFTHIHLPYHIAKYICNLHSVSLKLTMHTKLPWWIVKYRAGALHHIHWFRDYPNSDQFSRINRLHRKRWRMGRKFVEKRTIQSAQKVVDILSAGGVAPSNVSFHWYQWFAVAFCCVLSFAWFSIKLFRIVSISYWRLCSTEYIIFIVTQLVELQSKCL